MPRKSRYHLDELPEAQQLPKHLTRQEFGRKLYNEILKRNWSQSDLARKAGLPRDSISTYVRGKVLPTPLSLQKLADALGMEPHEVLPNAVENAMDEDQPAMSLNVSHNKPNQAWLRINRMVPTHIGAEVIRMLAESNHEAINAMRSGLDSEMQSPESEKDASSG